MADESFDEDLAKTFFEELYRDIPDEEWISIFAIDRTVDLAKNNRRIHWARVGEMGLLLASIRQVWPTCCVWFGVSTRRKKLPYGRGGEDDCVTVPAFWADLDVQGPGHKSDRLPPDEEAARSILEGLPAPSMTVRTGGGLQPYWKLAKPVPVAKAREGLDRWAYTLQERSEEKGWALDNVFEAARILRVPGTYNRKPQLATPIKVTLELPA